ncbi:hypothetical protein B4U84_20380 [Westiellopsis prolifica IICB1]|nr:hypothetical protein B4U84_20380 [Westiellopsis prolifica IICB1]
MFGILLNIIHHSLRFSSLGISSAITWFSIFLAESNPVPSRSTLLGLLT